MLQASLELEGTFPLLLAGGGIRKLKFHSLFLILFSMIWPNCRQRKSFVSLSICVK